jgi:ribose transport system substrate-binding protein
MRRSLKCFLAVVLAVSAGCQSAPPPAKTNKTVVVIANTPSDFWKIAKKGSEKADGELSNVQVIFKMPFGVTKVEQDRLIQDALKKDGADGIAISPTDPEAQKKAINDAAKKVALITQDSDAPDTDRLLYLGADNRAAGRQAGELMKTALPQGGKIMVFVGKREAQNAKERFEGLKEALQGSKVEVVNLMTDDNDLTQARDNVVTTLDKNPDVVGLVGLWGYNGPIILAAVTDKKKVGKVKIVCFDDESDVLNGIKDGSVFATVAQQPFEYGYQSVQLLAKILGGDRSVIPERRVVYIPTIVIQRNNVEAYKNKQSQLLAGQ